MTGSKLKRGYNWSTDYSQTRFIGGPRPRDIEIYIGNDFVEQELKEKQFKIPSITKKVPIPNF